MICEELISDNEIKRGIQRLLLLHPSVRTVEESEDYEITFLGVEKRGSYFEVKLTEPTILDDFTKGLATQLRKFLSEQNVRERVYISDTSDTYPFTSRGVAIGCTGRVADPRVLASYEIMGNGRGKDGIPKNSFYIHPYIDKGRIPPLNEALEMASCIKY